MPSRTLTRCEKTRKAGEFCARTTQLRPSKKMGKEEDEGRERKLGEEGKKREKETKMQERGKGKESEERKERGKVLMEENSL